MREVTVAQSLRHPLIPLNFTAVLADGPSVPSEQIRNTVKLVMDFIPSVSLMDAIQATRGLPEPAVRVVVAQVVQILSCLHELGYVYVVGHLEGQYVLLLVSLCAPLSCLAPFRT